MIDINSILKQLRFIMNLITYSTTLVVKDIDFVDIRQFRCGVASIR